MTIYLRFLIGSLLAFVCCGSYTFAQSTEAEISSRLKNKPLYLRGFWQDANLKFDADGNPAGKPSTTSFTLSGFEFRSAHIKKDKLQIEGKRIGVEFIKDIAQRVPLGQKIRLEIMKPSNGDFTQALNAIFADGLTEIASSLPSYWQRWAKSKLPSANTSDDSAPSQNTSGSAAPKKVGGSVQAPVLTARREAEFDEAARQLKYSGNSLIGLVVDADGLPTQLRVVRPMGVGLDEQALAAVHGFRFSPATQNGKPVPVEINVEVNFQIF